jgi:hypothetical protein
VKGKGTKRKGKKEKKGPKRPLSAYMFFCQQKRQEAKEVWPFALSRRFGRETRACVCASADRVVALCGVMSAGQPDRELRAVGQNPRRSVAGVG